ncbi:zinc-ribbon domain-containing protein [Chondromyces crocatus]|uniref:Zinc finger/thioredoxin putative domain-containing protein n=1 Tax=Chondromyces crocatus TaxID=52 RepID=A0A0K1E728_CHOCO|nr:zinc-ribbon domain-containing protein [Chondromyces crocatus]AKT36676.1 uncharacterized protein CMC5_007960 [Chondromyces crocatus]
MDVTCDRCRTEYEFDDALVSGRGTSVKCTNCGHLFKVRRADGALPERWQVRTADGREFEFKMLRELQAAIGRAEISREDVLSRGSGPSRRLGEIAELEPFFRGVGGMMSPTSGGGRGPSAPARVRTTTPSGLGGPVPTADEDTAVPFAQQDAGQRSGATLPPEPFVRSPSVPPVSGEPTSAEPLTPPVGRLPMMPPTPSPGATQPPAPARRKSPPGVIVSPEDAPPVPERHGPTDSPSASQRGQGEGGSASGGGGSSQTALDPQPMSGTAEEEGAALSPRQRPPREVRVQSAPLTPTPSEIRFSISEDAYGEPRFTSVVPSRRAGAARWMVGLIVAGLAVLAGVILVPKYLKPLAHTPERASDERATSLVAEANQALLEGDLEGARDKLLQASALAERDPKIAVDLARLETAGADLRWLRLRLVEGKSPDEALARDDLEVAVNKARNAVEHAEAVAAGDPAVQRARVDLVRLQGDLGRARLLVGTLTGGGAQADNALALAALDVAEAQPSWPVAIGRLRTAAVGDQGLGRARGLLIYALARSGDLAAARAEYERLVASGRRNPLAPALKAFLDRLDSSPALPATMGDAGVPDAAESGMQAPAGGPREGRASDGAAVDPSPSGRLLQRGAWNDEGRVPDDYVAPDQGAAVEVSDLPGVAPPAASAGAAANGSSPAEIDTSDLSGSNYE